ncbi:methyltransferase domain-containing protein [Candidatus Woesearchaeota archaeon]|jgi:2-polyprenyl-3-methyl-5-hydroxy-6-metoxy-1,4-benzoquinol methylase|nr:methyltransferase domain-containing protein [Candidatus Woesearchaeota archaeon]
MDHSLTYKSLTLKNSLHILRLKKIERLVLKITKDEKIATYTDIGCSNGFITNIISNKLKSISSKGFDHSEENIKIAQNRYSHINFNYIDLNIYNESSEKFDFITCFETLEHVGNIDNALQNILSRKSKNGIILLSVPIEVGFVGFTKYIIKRYLYKYNLDELEVDNKSYIKELLFGDISKFRLSSRDGFGTHFGFNYKRIEVILKNNSVKYKKSKIFGTVFYVLQ